MSHPDGGSWDAGKSTTSSKRARADPLYGLRAFGKNKGSQVCKAPGRGGWYSWLSHASALAPFLQCPSVMLRITTKTVEDLVIQVDGRLDGDGVAELEKVCRDAKQPVTLDLTHLQSADNAGVELLRTLAEEGAVLHGASPYIRLLLQDDA